jgi:large subunit ribosomal protein L18
MTVLKMAHKKIRTIRYRRKREQKTNYKKRLTYIISGKPRAVIRSSSNTLIVQIVDYAKGGDLIRVHVNSRALLRFGWKYNCGNLPAAYLSGLLAGKLAKEKKISEAVIDFGLQRPVHKSKLFAVVKGLTDAGINTSADESVLPDADRLSGKHIASYAESLKKEGDSKLQKQFCGYLKSGAEPGKITESFNKTKEAILKDAGLKKPEKKN